MLMSSAEFAKTQHLSLSLKLGQGPKAIGSRDSQGPTPSSVTVYPEGGKTSENGCMVCPAELSLNTDPQGSSVASKFALRSYDGLPTY